MRFLLWPLIFFIFLIRPAYPQSPYADSLIGVNAALPDNKEKADNLILLARHYRSVDPDVAWNYCDKAYEVAFSLNYPEAYAEALYIKGLILCSQDNYREAMAFNERYIHIADSMGDQKRLAKGCYNQGSLHSNLLEYENALVYFGKSLPSYLSMKDTLGIMANYNAIGNVFMNQAKYDSASFYFLRSVDIYEKKGEDLNLGTVLNNLSDVYREQGQYEKALKYARKNIELILKYDDLEKLALGYNSIGRIYSDLDNSREAFEFYEKARELHIRLKDTVSISNIENNIGILYQNQGNYTRAIEYFDRALEGFIQKDYTRGIILALGNKGVAFSCLGKYEDAIALQEKVVEMSDRYELQDYRQDALENLSWYWMKLGNHQKAFEYQSRFYALKDSIFDLEKARLINDLTMKYEKEKDEAQILELEKTNLEKDLSLKKRTIQRNAYFFTGLGVLSIALFLVLYFRQRARKDKIIAQQQIKQLEEEKKLMAAKLLVEGQEEERKRIARDLHDGLGVLLSATRMQFTSIKDTSPENRPLIERATQLLEQASGDVRKISHNMMPGLLTRLGLYEAIEDLIDNLNDSGKITARCEIPEDLARLPENKEIMLYRIVQEMVNNTLKYAEAKEILFKITALPDHLEIYYADDGKGFDAARMLQSESIGLKSIQSRVDFLNGKMSLDSGPGTGTKYTLIIPLA